jgi:four helix bundle protein
LRDFRYLDVWHKAHAFTLKIHAITESFPKIETYGLSATLRRSASHMTMKIAEAAGHDEQQDFHKGIRMARGLGVEVEYQLLLARDLHFIEPTTYEALQHQLIEVRKMLSGLIRLQPV